MRFGKILLSLTIIALFFPRRSSADSNPPAVPAMTLTVDGSRAGSAKMRAANRFVEQQSASTLAMSYLQRGPLRGTSWYWGAGLKADSYQFSNQGDFPIDRLQDVAGQFSIGYFLGADEVASLKIYPGFYFENHMNRSSLDIPIELVSGVPIVHSFNGVVGFENARFLHHPLPIFGFVWDVQPTVRIQAVYPEPALVVRCSDRLEARIAGQLIGDGFKTDPGSAISRVSYYSYRVGAGLTYKVGAALAVSASAGYEAMRVFDAYRESRRWDSDGAPYAELNIRLVK